MPSLSIARKSTCNGFAVLHLSPSNVSLFPPWLPIEFTKGINKVEDRNG